MKKMIMTLAVILSMTTTTSFAQGMRGDFKKLDKTEMAKMRTNRLAKELNLDETQTAALLQLNTEYADKMGPEMGPGPGMGPGGPEMGPRPDGPEMGPRPDENMQPDSLRQGPSEADIQQNMKQMEENRAAYEAEVKKILTEEQYAKYEEIQKQRMKHGPRHGGPRGGHDFHAKKKAQTTDAEVEK